MKHIFIGLVSLYQQIVSPWSGERCRFYPSCSEYTRQAIESRGPFWGIALGLKRLLSCHPLHRGGYDPIHG